MKYRSVLYLLVPFIGLLTASERLDAEGVGHGPHVHGVAELTFAIENAEMHIQFSSPAESLVGFEHIALTEEEKEVVGRAKNTLTNSQKLFSFNGAKCTVEKVEVNVEGISVEERFEANHDDIDAEQLDRKDGQARHTEHGDIQSLYRFHCPDISRLASIDVKLFAAFPGIHQINARWVTDHHQGARTLTASDHVVTFK